MERGVYKACKINDCDRDASGYHGGGRGLCTTHYQRWRRHGDPERGGPVQRQTTTGQACSIDGCTKAVIALDYCENHYRRYKRYGDPKAGRLSPNSLTNEERFWRKVNKTDTCWLWLDRPNSAGYGTINIAGVPVMAHRYVLALSGRPVAADMTVDHLCKVRLCVNPAHLEEVTIGENLRRARVGSSSPAAV